MGGGGRVMFSKSVLTWRRTFCSMTRLNAEICQIKWLTPEQPNKFKIKAKAIEAELNEISSEKYQGGIFNVILKDDSGDIRATAFNNEAKKFAEIVKNDEIYNVSNAKVQPIHNPDFNDTDHDYELLLTNSTFVIPASISEKLPGPDSNVPGDWKPIDEIDESSVGSTVDVLGYCVSVNEPRTIIMKAEQKEVQARDITLIDQGESPIKLTLWDASAEVVDEALVGQIIRVRNAKVREFRGNVNLSGGDLVNEDLAKKIKQILYDRRMLSNSTFVIPASISGNLPGLNSNVPLEFKSSLCDWKPIDKIDESALGSRVDILGYCMSVGEVRTIVSKYDDKKTLVRDITLIDQGESPIKLTLWDESAEVVDEALVGQIVGVRNAYVKEFRGNVNLSGGNLVNEDLAKKIKQILDRRQEDK